jgi:hypothetical protein
MPHSLNEAWISSNSRSGIRLSHAGLGVKKILVSEYSHKSNFKLNDLGGIARLDEA